MTGAPALLGWRDVELGAPELAQLGMARLTSAHVALRGALGRDPAPAPRIGHTVRAFQQALVTTQVKDGSGAGNGAVGHGGYGILARHGSWDECALWPEHTSSRLPGPRSHLISRLISRL